MDRPTTPDSTTTTAPQPPREGRSPDWWLMFRKFLRHGTSIASFVPSSPYLAGAMLKGIDFTRADCIVELGAGTGPITSQLVKRAKPGCRLIINELDPDFCARLRQKFPTADIVEGDAAALEDSLKERGIGKVDHVLSGLPLPSFPSDLRGSIIRSSVGLLNEGGTFRQLTNMPWIYYRLYRRYFEQVKFRFVAANFPPAGVYVCQQYAPAA